MSETGGLVVGPWLLGFVGELGELLVIGRRREKGKETSGPVRRKERRKGQRGMNRGRRGRRVAKLERTEIIQQVHILEISRRDEIPLRSRQNWSLSLLHWQLEPSDDPSRRLLSQSHRDRQAEQRIVDSRPQESCKRYKTHPTVSFSVFPGSTLGKQKKLLLTNRSFQLPNSNPTPLSVDST